MADHITDVASSDRHTVKPWLSSRLDFSPPVFDFAGDGFPLVGARLDYAARSPVAAVVYKHRQHIINVFVGYRSEQSGAVARMSRKRGYNLIGFHAGGMSYWAVSDLNVEDLRKLVALLQGSLQSPPLT
jgi:anti-sigma factor RsiW